MYHFPNEDKDEIIYNIKINLTPEKLSKFFPEEFCEYLKYTRNLNFEQDPDYNYLRNLFCKILERMNNTNDLKFSWLLIDKNEHKFFRSKKITLKKVKIIIILMINIIILIEKKLALKHGYYGI